MTTDIRTPRGTRRNTVAACAIAAWALAFGPAFADDKIIVGLITKTNTNPFFAKMKEGAEAKAKELGSIFAASPASMMATIPARSTPSSAW